MSRGTKSAGRPRGGEPDTIPGFGADARGELYILDRDGDIFKIVPVLASLQVSGPGAAGFIPSSTDWTWEDLEATSSHPITSYRVYRHPGRASGPFDCVFAGPSPVWAGGDPAAPAAGDIWTYVVTATNGGGEETVPGNGSDGTLRILSALACP